MTETEKSTHGIHWKCLGKGRSNQELHPDMLGDSGYWVERTARLPGLGHHEPSTVHRILYDSDYVIQKMSNECRKIARYVSKDDFIKLAEKVWEYCQNDNH